MRGRSTDLRRLISRLIASAPALVIGMLLPAMPAFLLRGEKMRPVPLGPAARERDFAGRAAENQRKAARLLVISARWVPPLAPAMCRPAWRGLRPQPARPGNNLQLHRCWTRTYAARPSRRYR